MLELIFLGLCNGIGVNQSPTISEQVIQNLNAQEPGYS